jgi:Tfp pilus assembly protein PilO
MKFIFPSILIAIALGVFLSFVNPTYQEIKVLKANSAVYDSALTNSQRLQEQRDALSARYRTFPTENLSKLAKLLPDNVDNIRLIIDVQQMAQTYGMSISSIKFDSTATVNAPAAGNQMAAANAGDIRDAQKDYGTFNLEFSTTGSYDNFLKFLKDLETSLRVTDIQSISFSSDQDTKTGYTYVVKLKTYWLKA